jgi:MOSC domain-containing protein YiiM
VAHIVSVNISGERGVPKQPAAQGLLRRDFGIQGDAHAANWDRQISLLAQESIDKMRALGLENLGPGAFAENITTGGMELHTLPLGTRLKLGECEVEITQIGKECHHHCRVYQEVGACVMPAEGVFARVIAGGIVKPGDPIVRRSPA